jgi:hypothetical protein
VTTVVFGALTMFMVSDVRGVAAHLGAGNPGIYVCAGGAVLFAVIRYKLQRIRQLSFDIDADELDLAAPWSSAGCVLPGATDPLLVERAPLPRPARAQASECSVASRRIIGH